MNVFVLCTGRCGSTTFINACSHLTNYSAGHETRSRRAGPAKLAYPASHIEADNRLSWHLGRLDDCYGDDAMYVHLSRDPDAVARSLALRWNVVGGIIPAYMLGILKGGANSRLLASRDYVATVERNIALFLRDKTNVMRIDITDAEKAFPAFWERIGGQGSLDNALQEWSTRHNASKKAPWRKRLRRARGMTRLLFKPELGTDMGDWTNFDRAWKPTTTLGQCPDE